ncbi:glycosyltransferase family 4 protein [Streptomyces calvus]
MDEPEICLIVRRFTIGGLERVVLLLANELSARGRRVHVIILDPVGLRAMITEMAPEVTIHVLSGSWAGRLGRLRELTRGRIAHFHPADGRIHPTVRWALRGHPGVFVTYHSDYTPVRNRLTNMLDRAITGRSRGVVACSKSVEDFCLREVGLPAGLVTVVDNAVPAPSAGSVRVERDGVFTLVAVATMNPHKNHVGLLQGFALARRRGHRLRLRLIGDGPAVAEAFGAAAELGVSADVEWYGGLWQSSVVGALLSASDAFVSASRNEGLPMSVLEALQHGLPMVLSDISPHRDAAADAAVYFDPDAPAQFADRLAELLDADAHRRHAAASRRRSALFSAEEFTERHLKLYDAVRFPEGTGRPTDRRAMRRQELS